MPSSIPERAPKTISLTSHALNRGRAFNRSRSLRRTISGSTWRKVACFVLITSLLILPGPGLPLNELRALASTAIDATTGPLRHLPNIFRPSDWLRQITRGRANTRGHSPTRVQGHGFGSNPEEGSRNLSTFVVQSCVNKRRTHNDLSFVVN